MADAAADSFVASLADRYVVERELGAGGMAVVYRARDLRHQRLVAIKVLRPELAAAVGHERFLKEIRLTANLQHPHILPLYDSGEAAGRLYYVMPLVEGESLRARLAGGSLPIADVVRILSDVAQALSFAHERGVIHRDIKPDNVLLAGGAAVVADFGIAKAVAAARTEAGEAATSTGISLGTPAYMAPEQAAADPRVDHRADIYAFGCLAYELLAGRPPFEGSPQRILAGQLSEAPRPVAGARSETPPALSELIGRCLEKEPEARPQSAAELLGVLEAAGVPAARPIPLAQLLAVALAAALLLVLAARVATDQLGLPGWVIGGAAVLAGGGFGLIVFAAMRGGPGFAWRRAARSGLAAVAAFVLLTAGYMGMRAAGIGPVGTLVAKGQLKERPLLLLADFTVKSADSALASPVREAVRTSLSQSKVVGLLGHEARTNAVRRMQKPPESRVDVALAREIAEREGAEAIVDGEVTGVGPGFIVTLRLLSAETGNELTTHQATAKRSDELIGAVDAAARALRGKIGESLKTVRASQPLARFTTTSVEALKLFYGGANAEARIARLRRAVALDSNFAGAWGSMATAMSNARYPRASIDSALTRAYRLRDRLMPGERRSIETRYFSLGPYPDRERAIQGYLATIQAGDSSVASVNNLGLNYMFRRDLVRAESLFRVAIARRGDAVAPRFNIVVPLFARGLLQQAESIVAEGLKRSPLEAGFIMHLRTARYHRGRLEDYARGLDSGRVFALGSYQRLNSTQASAQLATLRGRIDEAERYWATVAMLDSIMGRPHLVIADSIRAAQLDIWIRNRAERGIARLDAELARPSFSALYYRDRPDVWVAGLYAMAGQAAKARGILDRMTRHGDTARLRVAKPEIHLVTAEIALAEGRPRDALVEFRFADRLPDGPVDDNPLRLLVNLGRAFDQAGEADSAIAMFEQYLSTPYWYRVLRESYHEEGLHDPPDVLFRPYVHERLGVLYESKGDAVKAAQHYRQFIELWKDADPELQPRVAAAKRRVSQLTDREPRQP